MPFRIALAALALSLAACTGSAPVAVAPAPTPDPTPAASAPRVTDGEAVRTGVRALLDMQVAAWNDGSIRGFMDGYTRADSLTFLSGGSLRQGWQESYYAYVRGYPDRASMGTLGFEEIVIRPLADDLALAYGRWRLTYADDRPESSGLFSLLVRRGDEGWRVVHDHTSSG